MNTQISPVEIELPQPAPLVSRFRRHHRFEHYYRLAALVFLANAVVVWYAWQEWLWFAPGTPLPLQQVGDMALYNFTLAIFMRQQYVVNLLFKLATFSKTRSPLWLRWRLGKVYHFGGLHSGSAMSGSLWFIALTVMIVVGAVADDARVNQWLLATAGGISLLLAAMVFTAMPWFRGPRHNTFEKFHRFGGWSTLALFYTLHWQMVFASTTPWYEHTASWLLLAITFSIALPWLRLKKVPVEVVKPSNHAVLAKFDYGVTPFPGSSMAISVSPLIEWHSFANIPSPDNSGYRLAISRAGDWTGRFIDNPPSHVWVKGIPTAGVANIEVLFHKVVYIATGSGIGPVLPHLLAHDVPSHLVWATRSPRKTYGDALVDEILEAEPTANIWNTDTHGKPDMVKLSYEAYQRFGAEAVIVISNQKLTRLVVTGLESRGIPAYGAIWDS